KMSWWADVASVTGISADGKAWHFHPLSLITNKVSDSRELRVRAFLRMIRVGEGTEGINGYEKLFGGSSFIKDHGKTFDDHPQIKIKKSGYTSSAAGAYQVMGYTWNDDSVIKIRKKLNIKNFSPLSQDIFCLGLLKYKVRGDALDLIVSNKIQEAIESSSYEWASLPPGRYGQPIKSMDEALAYYEKFLNEEILGTSDLQLTPGFLKELGY
ncbi:glycoside hydrolase family 104 protein, partial [Pseudomonas sp. NPDC098747]|uniref:glycoside hydrolase family 24 protein n=1 Tax=Pseudomonas sp. NPDC098747 TaxID=3364487 RepID=UPI003839D0BE